MIDSEVLRAWYFGVLLAVAQSRPPANTFEYSPAGPTPAQIDEYLTRKHSPMAGLGQSFASSGHDYNVDPRLIVAIAGAETTFGNRVCADKNAWNWFYRRNCPASPFETYEAGLERVTRFMRLSYLNRGYDSIELIRHKYCASGCDNWEPLVTAFQAEMPGRAIPPASGAPLPSKSSPAAPTTLGPQSPRAEGIRIFGLPVFVLFFVGALLVANWAFRLFR